MPVNSSSGGSSISASAAGAGSRWKSWKAAHNVRYSTPLPSAFSEYEKAAKPLWRNRSDHTTRPAPAIRPTITRPVGPISPRSTASFNPYAVPINSSTIAMRLNI